MRLGKGLIVPLIFSLLSAALMFITAPAANAAGGCNDPLRNWRLDERIVDGDYVIKNYHSSSSHASCLTVRRMDGARMNVVLYIRRDFYDADKKTTKSRRQILDVRKVAAVIFTERRLIDVWVYAGRVNQKTAPYRGATTLHPS